MSNENKARKLLCPNKNCRIETRKDGKVTRHKRELVYVGLNFWGQRAYTCPGCKETVVTEKTDQSRTKNSENMEDNENG